MSDGEAHLRAKIAELEMKLSEAKREKDYWFAEWMQEALTSVHKLNEVEKRIKELESALAFYAMKEEANS